MKTQARLRLRQPTPSGCKGFRWIGQSWEHCDGCGKPFWEHTHDSRIRRDASPFDDDPFDYVPISTELKQQMKARWADHV
jgi:predicted amidophosphoribosyltransferase